MNPHPQIGEYIEKRGLIHKNTKIYVVINHIINLIGMCIYLF